MSRSPRIKEAYTTYHIILRGNERKNIFISDDDRNRFIETLYRMKEKYNFELEAYCLMNNHVHLILDDNGNDISQIMRSINTSYAVYFNKIYKRVGHLFQDRFKSEIVMDDRYLISLSAYIHNNPVRAGVVKQPEEYTWSSMNEYIGKRKNQIVRINRILSLFSPSRVKAENRYYEFVRKFEPRGEMIMDIEEDVIIEKRKSGSYLETMDEARQRLDKELGTRGVEKAGMKNDKVLRKEIMEMLRRNSTLTLVQIGELCGGFAESTVCLTLKGRNVK